MQERKEITKPPEKVDLSYASTPYILGNLGFKTAVISFSVSTLSQPFHAVLTRLQVPSVAYSGLNMGLFRGLYRGFIPNAVAGQKRGAVAVTAKQTNREVVEEEMEAELPLRQHRLLGTFFFSQADHLISNALYGKGKLESAQIITKDNFNWSLANYGKLTTVNWGSRSLAGFINFSAIGFMGDYVSSFYNFGDEFHNKLAGGATSGVLATLCTTIPNSYADRKLLASKMEHGQLLTTSSFTMFGSIKSHVKAVGAKEALTTFMKHQFLKEFLIRSPMSALTFSIIFGLDHMMGVEPLKGVWPGVDQLDSASSESPARKL